MRGPGEPIKLDALTHVEPQLARFDDAAARLAALDVPTFGGRVRAMDRGRRDPDAVRGSGIHLDDAEGGQIRTNAVLLREVRAMDTAAVEGRTLAW